MTSLIARKEFIDLTRDGRYRILAAVVLALSLLSLGAGWRTFTDLNRQHSEAQAATRAQWLGQEKKNPHSAAHYGVYAFKPKSQLAMIDTGVDPYVGVAVWLEAHKQNEFAFRPAQDRTAIQRFGEMTGAEVLQVLLPLVIVLLGFSAFSGEREQGTLRQLMSLGVSTRALALGKALGITAALSLILAPATVMAIIALAWSSGTGLLAGDPLRTLVLAGVYGAYFLLLIAITLTVSAAARSSRAALLVLLSFWFLNSVVAPRASADLAAAIYPTPSAIDFQQALDRDLNDPRELNERLTRRKQELFARYGVTTVDALPVAFQGVSLQEGENHGNEVFDRHFGALYERYEHQNRVVQWAGLAAPMLAVRSLSMGLAGTDVQQHRHFAVAAEEYRRGIQRVLNDDILSHPTKGAYLADQGLWSRVPEFTYSAPPVPWVASHYLVSFAVLALWFSFAAWLLLRGSGRVRVD